jgi:hypothetical protein
MRTKNKLIIRIIALIIVIFFVASWVIMAGASTLNMFSGR